VSTSAAAAAADDDGTSLLLSVSMLLPLSRTWVPLLSPLLVKLLFRKTTTSLKKVWAGTHIVGGPYLLAEYSSDDAHSPISVKHARVNLCGVLLRLLLLLLPQLLAAVVVAPPPLLLFISSFIARPVCYRLGGGLVQRKQTRIVDGHCRPVHRAINTILISPG